MLKFLLGLGTGLLVGYLRSPRPAVALGSESFTKKKANGSKANGDAPVGHPFASESFQMGEGDIRDELGLSTPIHGTKL